MSSSRVFNEQAVVADSIHRLHRHLRDDFPFAFRITIADNASADDTPRIARALAGELPDVRVVRLDTNLHPDAVLRDNRDGTGRSGD
jgi:glycosyltransferase involved in cell wall biosynthesis